jgi:hypothetical protein
VVMAATLAELLLEEGSTEVLHEKVKITAINTESDKSVFCMIPENLLVFGYILIYE